MALFAAARTFFQEYGVPRDQGFGRCKQVPGPSHKLNDECGYVLNQEMTINTILKDHDLEMENGVRTPIGEECNDVDNHDEEILDATAGTEHASVKAFQSLVGSLLWIACCTLPDICFAVYRATSHTHRPTLKDWKMAKRILHGI